MLDWAKAIHQAIGIENPRLFIALFAAIGFLFFGAVGWIVDRGYRMKLQEDSAPVARTSSPTKAVQAANPAAPPNKIAVPPPMHKAPENALPKSKIGNDNTLVDVPIPMNMGDGNTIVNTHEANGNTLLTRGGTAIGKGACADPTSVAIGTGANAGACAKHPDPAEKAKPN